MKTVVPSSQVFHLWAHQSQSNANNGHNGNVSFDGPTLYSYSTPIANIVKDRRGKSVVLIYSGSYSVTTTQHQHSAQYACRNVHDVYHVEHIGITGGRTYGFRLGGDPDAFHKANVLAMVKAYRAGIDKAKRAHGNHEWRASSLAGDLATAREYAERFKAVRIKGLVWPDHDKAWGEVVEIHAKRQTPEAAAKREKDRARRDAKMRQANLDRAEVDKIAAWYRGERVQLSRGMSARLRIAMGNRNGF
jgi:hypothetical protein